MSTMVERVARAIDEAEVGYSINLTRLVDGVSTYMLRYHGAQDTLEFGSYDEAAAHVRMTRNERRARAAIEAMMEPTDGMVLSQGKSKPENAATETQRERAEALNRSVRHVAVVTWREMIQAALKEQA